MASWEWKPVGSGVQRVQYKVRQKLWLSAFEENKAGERRFRESPRARDVATKNDKHSSAKKGKEKMPQEYKQEAGHRQRTSGGSLSHREQGTYNR